jgi:hypothetical protein
MSVGLSLHDYNLWTCRSWRSCTNEPSDRQMNSVMMLA